MLGYVAEGLEEGAGHCCSFLVLVICGLELDVIAEVETAWERCCTVNVLI